MLSNSALIKHAKKNVPAHVIGLNVPQPKAHIYIEPGNISHIIPAIGINNIPATADMELAVTSAINARFGDNPNK